MQTAEIAIIDGRDFAARLKEMRVWLDGCRFKPSTCRYTHVGRQMMIRVSFAVHTEAQAFARKFGGLLVDGL